MRVRPEFVARRDVTRPQPEAGLRVVASPEPLAVLGLPPQAWPRVAESGFADPGKGGFVLGTPGELTLVVPWGSAPVARGLFPGVRVDGPYRLLTLVATDRERLLPRVLSALADAGVTARANASLDRDHVLVPDEDADVAVDVLHGLAEA